MCLGMGPEGTLAEGIGKDTLKVKKKGRFRVFSGCFQGIVREFQCPDNPYPLT